MNIPPEAITALNTALIVTHAVLAYFRHKHLERDLRKKPMTFCFEISFTGETLEPVVKVVTKDTGEQLS